MPANESQDAARLSTLRLRLALDAAAIGVWEYEVASGKLTWDERVYEVAEIDPGIEPSFADHFLAVVHPEDQAMVAKAFGRLVDEGDGAHLSLTCRVVGARTGRLAWAALEGRALGQTHGGLRVIGTARDVTVERSAVEQLQELNERLEQRVAEAVAERQIWADMFQGTDDPIAAVDTRLRVIALNPAYARNFERYFGCPLKVGDDLNEALADHAELKPIALSLWRRALEGEVVEVPRSREADPDGAFYDIKFRPLNDRNGKRIGAFQYSREVTHRVEASRRMNEAQELLNRAQKMEALGHLTGGVAHDFNNLLQVISGNLQLLRKDVSGNARGEKRVENALAGVARGSKLASQLLAFGRRQPLEPKVVNLGRFLNGMDDMLRRALGEEVQLETVISGGLWNTLVDPSQIENAVLNLAINARDAMDGRGRLTIEAGNALLDDAYARLHAEMTPGQYVMIAVTDTGAGMPAEILDRVFEPFFSTKSEGAGTGLGLSMVHGLIKQSGGHIKIYSEVGEGTTVKLYLPRAMQNEDVWAEPAPQAIRGGDETILVVEDDDEVRETAVALLTDLGYKVLRSSDAASGLAVVESGVEIDLLFTDVVMPGPIRSPELARRARDLKPNLPVLFTSGYTQNAIIHGGRLDPGVELLPKPYTREALARKIRHVLANSAKRASPISEGERSALAPQAGGTDQAGAQTKPGLALLLVEDDDAIRANTAEMLTGLGHAVFQVADAASALHRLRERSFDVIIADRGLPDSSGDELAQKALQIAPGTPLVFASGEAVGLPDDAVHHAVYLIKPYGLADLEHAIAQAVGFSAGKRAISSQG
jgi:signal transduction histidine kinase/DNA-binding response OmpR family regulator